LIDGYKGPRWTGTDTEYLIALIVLAFVALVGAWLLSGCSIRVDVQTTDNVTVDATGATVEASAER
jgi:hypothetical protein